MTTEIDWTNIAGAGVEYANDPARDTVIASWPETDRYGEPVGDSAEYVADLPAGKWASDQHGRLFRVLGAGSVQGSVIVENENGDQFHADLETRLMPNRRNNR